MQMNFSMASETTLQPTNIKVVGVGGGGGNAVNRMIRSGMKNVEFIAMNTDAQMLSTSLADKKLNIGVRLTRGFGAGGDALIGQRAAEESREDIQNVLKGADMVFITAGMGGGTGTGAAPVVADIARSMGILTIAVVTKPFGFENRRRMKTAEMGIASLKEKIDALIVVPNDRLKYVSTEKITLANAFAAADSVLGQGVQSIADIISGSGYINLDFADVESVVRRAGNAHMGVGRASGREKAEQAAMAAVNSPLLETKIDGASGVIVSITAPNDVLLDDIYYTSEVIAGLVSNDANLIWGFTYDDNLNDEMIVTVIATGFENDPNEKYKEDIRNYQSGREARQAAGGAAKAASAPEPAVVPAPEPVFARQAEPSPTPEPVAEPEPQPVEQPAVNPIMAQLGIDFAPEQAEPFAAEVKAAPSFSSAPEDDPDWLEPLDFGKPERRKSEPEPAVKTAHSEDFGRYDTDSYGHSHGSSKTMWDNDVREDWPDLQPIRPYTSSRDEDDYDDDEASGGMFSRLLGGGKKKKKR